MIPPAHLRTICLLLLGIVAACHGQKFTRGRCPPLFSSTNPTLTFANLVGTWREIARSPPLAHSSWKCVTHTFIEITANVRYSFAISGVRKIGGFGISVGTIDVGATAGANSNAATYFTYTLYKNGKLYTSRYYIVSSDNANYIVLYACNNFFLGKLDNIVILTKPDTSDALIISALNSLGTFGLTRSGLVFTYTPECL